MNGGASGGGCVSKRLATRRRKRTERELGTTSRGGRLRLTARTALALGFLVPVSLLGLCVAVWQRPDTGAQGRRYAHSGFF